MNVWITWLNPSKVKQREKLMNQQRAHNQHWGSVSYTKMNTAIKICMTAKLNGSKFINQGPSVWQRRLTQPHNSFWTLQLDDVIQIHFGSGGWMNDKIKSLSMPDQDIYTSQTNMGTIINLGICDETYHTSLTQPNIMTQDGLTSRWTQHKSEGYNRLLRPLG